MDIYKADTTKKNDEEEEKKPKGFKEKIYESFLENRKVFLWGAVTDKSAEDIIEKLLFLEEEDPGKPIYFFINSPGGAVTSGMAILDVMHMISSPVRTITMGMAASMGALLFSQGEKGHRYVFPHAKIMIHQPLISGQIIAPAIDIKIHAIEIKKTKDEINKILANATGHTVTKIEKDTDRDYYLNAKESIKYKIADNMINNLTDLFPVKKKSVAKKAVVKKATAKKASKKS